MNRHKITGGNGVQLYVVESGNPNGRPILFIHGFSQSWRAWSRQLASGLAEEYRLVAIDIRGHGLSDKPSDGYSESQHWADDIDAVIRTLSLERPVLSGWSYGPLIILDYIRHHGEASVAGIHFVDGVSKLGSDEALAVLTPEFLDLIPGFFSTDVDESVKSLSSLTSLCFTDLSDDDTYLMLGCGVSVPPHVRQGLLSRSIDNDDLLTSIKTPVLLTHGENDLVVKRSAAEQHASLLIDPTLDIVADCGHAPFWDKAEMFNGSLAAFCRGL